MSGLVRVAVRDADGRPVARARVFIESGPAPTADVAALSDARGEVVLAVPAPGRYAVGCAAEGLAAGRAVVEVIEGAEARVTVTLRG